MTSVMEMRGGLYYSLYARQGSRLGTIVDTHLRTHHHYLYKNSGTCRQEEEYEEITPETVSPNESMHVGELLHLVVCACVRLSLRARHHVCS